jgi:hypothetical protein
VRRLALCLTVLGALAAPGAAQAHHPLSHSEARAEFRDRALEPDHVGTPDYLDELACYRFSRYLFKCVALVVYLDGQSECWSGRVRATGRRHHRISVYMRPCS